MSSSKVPGIILPPIFFSSGLLSNRMKVYLYACRFSFCPGKSGARSFRVFDRSSARIAKDLKVPRKQVQNALRYLVGQGLLHKHEDGSWLVPQVCDSSVQDVAPFGIQLSQEHVSSASDGLQRFLSSSKGTGSPDSVESTTEASGEVSESLDLADTEDVVVSLFGPSCVGEETAVEASQSPQTGSYASSRMESRTEPQKPPQKLQKPSRSDYSCDAAYQKAFQSWRKSIISAARGGNR